VLDKRFSLGDRITTSDGFSGKVTSGENGKWKVKFDASPEVLARFKKKQFELYEPKDIEVMEGENRGYNEAIMLIAAVMAMSLNVFPTPPKKSKKK
jgi:hypothetical protein